MPADRQTAELAETRRKGSRSLPEGRGSRNLPEAGQERLHDVIPNAHAFLLHNTFIVIYPITDTSGVILGHTAAARVATVARAS